MFTPRPYQTEAINAGVEFFHIASKDNGFEILPTGSGKSVVIANIAKELEGDTLVLQPSKEILEQNFAKFTSYGYDASIYSASLGQKYVDKVTFATIGSIAKKPHIFRNVKNIIVDECHLVNPEEGMYRDFIKATSGAKVLGLTATPYRLSNGEGGSMLKFLNRAEPKVFKDLLYYVQNDVLFNAGHLAQLEYYDFNQIDRTLLGLNSAGTDFSEASMRSYCRQINMAGKIARYAKTILSQRKNLLIFCATLEDAAKVQALISGSVVLSGETETGLRSSILRKFKSGEITCLINVGVLTTGFDYPGLEAVLMGRSTMSLALYYQIIGRVMRIFQYPDGSWKKGWFVDLGGNINMFGKIETMQIRKGDSGLYSIWNNGRQLTNVPFSKN